MKALCDASGRTQAEVEAWLAEIDRAPDVLAEEDLRAADLFDFKTDEQHVVEAGGFQVFQTDAAHDEGNGRLTQQFALLVTVATQPFGTAALQVFQVIGVVDHTTGIGVLEVDADGEGKNVRFFFGLHGV